jgi:hypothetical protein
MEIASDVSFMGLGYSPHPMHRHMAQMHPSHMHVAHPSHHHMRHHGMHGADPDVEIMGFGAAAGDVYMEQANIKLAVRHALSSVAAGNCGAANEALGEAWQLFSSYAPVAVGMNQASSALATYKSLAAAEARVGRSCRATVNPGGMLGADLGAFSLDSVKASFQTHKKAWIIGGIVAALGVGAVFMKRS